MTKTDLPEVTSSQLSGVRFTAVTPGMLHRAPLSRDRRMNSNCFFIVCFGRNLITRMLFEQLMKRLCCVVGSWISGSDLLESQDSYRIVAVPVWSFLLFRVARGRLGSLESLEKKTLRENIVYYCKIRTSLKYPKNNRYHRLSLPESW